jgi:BirA family biotin operon repressor/biotin-[acetyl-CoA-carboxylase] ligase
LFVSFFHELKNINLSVPAITKINCLLVKKVIGNYYKKKIIIKKPNDLLINKKKDKWNITRNYFKIRQ